MTQRCIFPGTSGRRAQSRPVLVTWAALAAVAVTAAPATAATTTAAAARPHRPAVVSVQEVARQEVTPRPGSEPDTLVEPDTAVSPSNPLVAVTASHEGRFPDGGASAISHAWTRDGGRTWRHGSVAGITTATGGAWNRASDPVLAFAPDGSVYLSVLVLNDDPEDCRTAILVLRSTDGGARFAPPRTARYSATCEDSLDKNWIVVDNGRRSPHRGRIYQFWSSFLPTEVQQRVSWSDDRGVTWSADSILNPGATGGSQNSQPVVLNDGTVVDTYLEYTFAEEEIEAPEVRERGEATAQSTPAAAPAARPTEEADDPGLRILAQRSTDGGRTWSAAVTVAEQVGQEAPGVRCCLPSATVDPVTQTIAVAWITEAAHDILLARSHGGLRWSAPRPVTPPGTDTLYRVNVDVASWGGVATVSYADQDTAVAAGRYWQQYAVTSYDDARHFGRPLALGPPYDTRYAAQARGVFPGDYIGSAATRGRVYLNWALAYAPADPAAPYHQTVWGAALRP